VKALAGLLFLLPAAVGAQQLDVYFDFDRSDLNAAAVRRLDSLSGIAPGIEVEKIYGYCDWKGSGAYNDSLSMRRVRSAYRFLKEKQVAIRPGYEEKGFGEHFEQSPVQADNRKVTVVYRRKEMPPADPEVSGLSKSITEANAGDLIRLPNLYFFNNSARIVPRSEPTLRDLLCALQDHPELEIEIQGHICCQTERDIHDISTARARAVYVYLIRNHIDRRRLTYKGYGISRPLHPIPEKSDAEEDDNRRVEVRIVRK
jgi:outer membrane protein OmpA-like peptidoglycan-associated protein